VVGEEGEKLVMLCCSASAWPWWRTLLAVVEGAMRAEHGAAKIDEEQSTYHVGNEIVRIWRG
ncbi:MAG: hypothetical protein NZX77_15820, partial [Polyangiaceae bacterium]|nr:hypothetical protein [Polyangiaceae bacterium]